MTNTIYLPVIMQEQPTVPLPLGAQIENHVGQQSNWSHWVIPNRQYQIGMKWRDVETVRGTFNWSTYDPDFQALSGQRITVGIKIVPEWARLWQGYVASPPKEDCFQAFAQFAIALINRYKPDAIELFNEPDVDRDNAKWAEEYFGAWCINSGYYRGGNLYGKFLKSVYSIIHEACPNVRIIVGALIGAMPSSYEFYQGTLQTISGDTNPWDAWSFHKYIGIGGNFNAAFEFSAKIGAKVLSETSVTAKEDSELLKTEQAEYLTHLINNYQNSSIEVIQWYSLANNGWAYADLVRGNIATPAYDIWSKKL